MHSSIHLPFPRLSSSPRQTQPTLTAFIVSPVMPVSLSKIPTLRELYKSGVLRGVADPAKLRHPPKSALLDRVSL